MAGDINTTLPTGSVSSIDTVEVAVVEPVPPVPLAPLEVMPPVFKLVVVTDFPDVVDAVVPVVLSVAVVVGSAV